MENENANKARELYKSGLTLSDIAEQLNISPATVRSWKKRHKWDTAQDDEETATQRKSATRKRNATQTDDAPKGKGGRPPALRDDGTPKYDIENMVQAIRLYTNQCLDAQTGFPILKECCLLNDWDYDYVMELQRQHKKLSQSIKRLLSQKEICLERLAAVGVIDKTIAVFSLKQLGWRDRVEVAEAKPKDDVADVLEKHFAKRKPDSNS